ncbi:MAG: hypothetical protein methR_P3887 [Methyloprofundus sp.]|nr:MAG: hypothetical protein methR_P3887 [Methyloprofundus sp.]
MQNNALKPHYCLCRIRPANVHILIVSLFAFCFIGLFTSHVSHADKLDQATVKALYTYKFGKFTQWPDNKLNSSSGHFQYCILGQNPFSLQTLNMITGKSVQGLPLTIAVFGSGLVPDKALAACHVVFISKSEKHRLSTILSSLQQAPVLTVSDISEFSAKGGMVTLINKQSRLRFQVNQTALQQANITLSSKIMELADIVNTGQR